MEPIDHREHHVVVSWLLWGFCPFRTKRHRRVEDVVIPDNTYLKVWLRFYSGIWICLPSNKVFTKTVSCRVMARGSQNLVIKGLKCIIIDIFFTLYVPNIDAWFCSDAGRKKVARRSELERMDWKRKIFCWGGLQKYHDSTSPCQLQMDPDKVCLLNHHRPMQDHQLSGRTRWARHFSDKIHPPSPWCPPD